MRLAALMSALRSPVPCTGNANQNIRKSRGYISEKQLQKRVHRFETFSTMF